MPQYRRDRPVDRRALAPEPTAAARRATVVFAPRAGPGETIPITGYGFGLSAGWGVGTPAAPSSVVDGAFVADGQQ